MKIQVVRCDGEVETLTLLGTVKVGEPVDGGQGTLLVEETGTTHFFRAEDGAYDGWGMEVGESEGVLNVADTLRFIDALEESREQHASKKDD